MAALSSRPDVVKVVLFGSCARDEQDAHSDLDFIVVQRTEQRFLDRLDVLYRTIVPRVACDFLVYTPDEFDRLLDESRFVAQAVRTGRVLHEA